jgi:Protein of unknown function (DUF4236)
MGFHYRKRIRIAPGIHLNVSEKGVRSASVKIGPTTLNSRGRATTSLGNGLTYRGKWRDGAAPSAFTDPATPAAQGLSGDQRARTNRRILFWFGWPMAFLLLFIWWPAGVTLFAALVLVLVRKWRHR